MRMINPRRAAKLTAKLIAGSTVLVAVAAAAQMFPRTRTISVTDFNRIRVLGPFVIDVKTGKSPTARTSGSPQALDRISVTQQGQMLIIRPASGVLGGAGKPVEPARLSLTVPMLRGISVEGTGAVVVDKMKGQTLKLGITGAGALTVGALDTDMLDLSLQGAGTGTLGGQARKALVYGRGTATLNATALKVNDLEMTWQSAGNSEIAANRTAKLIATGAGGVAITGKATCAVSALGAGNVICGGKAYGYNSD